eukprot:scaffold287_cov239-Pinguiococcus_pyrenoidosus.AAC.4
MRSVEPFRYGTRRRTNKGTPNVERRTPNAERRTPNAENAQSGGLLRSPPCLSLKWAPDCDCVSNAIESREVEEWRSWKGDVRCRGVLYKFRMSTSPVHRKTKGG